MADITRRVPNCDGDGDGEKGERGKRGKRGPRGHAGRDGFPIATDSTPPTLRGDGSPENPLQVINVATQPFPVPQTVTTIFVRTEGSDTTGDGSLENPYATVQRAVLDVPLLVPRGTRWIIDNTGTIAGGPEVFPDNYTFPAWVCSELITPDINDPIFFYQTAVQIRATPQPVAAIPLAATTVTMADIFPGGSVVPNPVSGLLTITLNHSRPSWGANALKGKFVIGAGNSLEHAVIGASSDDGFNAKIEIAEVALPTTPFSIMEPSAHLTGAHTDAGKGALSVFNCGSLGFGGQKIDSTDGDYGLYMSGHGQSVVQLCELYGPNLEMANNTLSRYPRNWISVFCYVTGPAFFINGLFDQCFFYSPVANIPASPNFRNMIIDGCDPIEVVADNLAGGVLWPAATPFLQMHSVCVRNGTGDGVKFHGTCGLLENVDIYGCVAGNGITADLGHGVLRLINVGTSGTPNGGVGIRVNDGIYVQVDAATSGSATPLTGAGGNNMQVGGLAVRAWSDFVAAGPTQFNEYDNAGVGTGVTGSRLFQP